MQLQDTIQNHLYKGGLNNLSFKSKTIVNTLNAHSFCLAKHDINFEKAIKGSDILLADGVSIVKASKILNNISVKKIAGADLHRHLLQQANLNGDKVFYLGSSPRTLELIESKIEIEFPKVRINGYSPPYKPVFNHDETERMISVINAFQPKYLFVGMTAPKQEKWVQENASRIESEVISSIGAVFDFYAGTVRRAPQWMIDAGLEWLFRLAIEPKRMWKRYLLNNTKFLYYVFIEKYF